MFNEMDPQVLVGIFSSLPQSKMIDALSNAGVHISTGQSQLVPEEMNVLDSFASERAIFKQAPMMREPFRARQDYAIIKEQPMMGMPQQQPGMQDQTVLDSFQFAQGM